ncbi:hypothetical protein CDD82_3378 [Ophiocordyceps australis]|uniref:Uncharacterized protein n=1 Tax=Ophiocordyceps australis TaxID=1399860 RepID=A0A2C5YI39_9HYPO|nr:hypothetical protein CDD82_3378 [Ophiocordyceps australis]
MLSPRGPLRNLAATVESAQTTPGLNPPSSGVGPVQQTRQGQQLLQFQGNNSPAFFNPLAPSQNQGRTQQTRALQPINTAGSSNVGQNSQTANTQQQEESASRLDQLVSASTGHYDDSPELPSEEQRNARTRLLDLAAAEQGSINISDWLQSGEAEDYDELFDFAEDGGLAGGMENQGPAAPGSAPQQGVGSLNQGAAAPSRSPLPVSRFGAGLEDFPAGTYPLVGTPSDSGSESPRHGREESPKRGRDESDDEQDGRRHRRARLDG